MNSKNQETRSSDRAAMFFFFFFVVILSRIVYVHRYFVMVFGFAIDPTDKFEAHMK